MKILFCTDGSSQAERAMRFGALIAAACQAEASILGVTEKAGDEDAILQALQGTQDNFEEHHLDAKLIIKTGRPEREIIKLIKKNHYDLVVIGAMYKTAFWRSPGPLWMSVPVNEIIEAVESPVLVVTGDRPALRRILLCTDGSAHIDKAVKFAGKIAQCVDAVVDLFHVMIQTPAIYAGLIQLEMDPYRVLESNSKLGRTLRRQKDLLEQFGVFGEIRLRQGLVVPELLEELYLTDYDLVVSGSSPATGKLSEYVMGDGAREIVNRVRLPVLVIRTGERTIMRLFKGLLGFLSRGSEKTSEASNS